jgi:4'-phosphopantetheinyl transferase
MKKISNQETEDFITLPAKLEGSLSPTYWSLPPPTLELSCHNVHVWLTKLNSLTTQVQQMAQCLSEKELIRAGRFHFKQDRVRFIACRAVLRMILGRYLHIEPNRVQFSYGPYGKPCLKETVGDDMLQFNLGHSNDIALYAFTRCREIGVDIEYLRALPDADQFAARFFAADEIATLNALPASQRRQAFFNCWTRKEAYVKAIGKGLFQPLD